MSMASEQTESTPIDLAKSILSDDDKRPMILFAGEATHEHYESFSHGAVESGWEAAGEILKFHNQERARAD